MDTTNAEWTNAAETWSSLHFLVFFLVVKCDDWIIKEPVIIFYNYFLASKLKWYGSRQHSSQDFTNFSPSFSVTMLREMTSSKRFSNSNFYSSYSLLSLLRPPEVSPDSAFLGESTAFGTEYNFNKTVNILDTRPTADVRIRDFPEWKHTFNPITKFTGMH